MSDLYNRTLYTAHSFVGRSVSVSGAVGCRGDGTVLMIQSTVITGHDPTVVDPSNVSDTPLLLLRSH
jgi:hypothetical protein